MLKTNLVKNLTNNQLLKILKIKSFKQTYISNVLNFNLLRYRLLLGKNCYPSICSKSAKFKRTSKYTRLNRWNLLIAANNNSLPNLKKFVW